MRTRFIIGAVVFQFLVLAYMVAERELVHKFGRVVYLRTMPIDPQDHFRGDYVRLNYEISNVGRQMWQDGLKDRKKDEYSWRGSGKDERIYAVLKVGEDGLGELEYITDRKPGGEFFIRGRLKNTWDNVIHATYGIEAYFVQQGKGLEIERGMITNGISVPLEMEAGVGGNGLAVLKNYRWSPAGIGVSINTESSGAGNRPRDRRIVSADLRLLNASKSNISVVDLPGGASFTLERDFAWGWSDHSWQWVGRDKAPPVTAECVHMLRPGEEYKFHIDFSDPAWFVKKDGEPPRSLSDTTNSMEMVRMRFVYRPPSSKECANLPDAGLIWHGSIASRPFMGFRVD
jgi:uncharacterized membrane-anchored protein